jgi:hypothetical protein
MSLLAANHSFSGIASGFDFLQVAIESARRP